MQPSGQPISEPVNWDDEIGDEADSRKLQPEAQAIGPEREKGTAFSVFQRGIAFFERPEKYMPSRIPM